MRNLVVFCLLLGTSLAYTINSDSFEPIIEHVNSLKTTWKADPNFPRHLTKSSFKRLLGAKKSQKNLLLAAPHHEISDDMIPKEFDARKAWPNCPSIAHIRDQGTCGSCWAVAAAGAFSDRVCIATNGSFTDPLSSEELLACCDECGDGCNGGYPEAAWDYFRTNGLVSGGDYNSGVGCQPYSIVACEHHAEGDLPQCSDLPLSETPRCYRKCTNPKYTKPFKADHHKVRRAVSFGSAKEIQKEIMTNGPVEAGFTVYADFPTYKSGVYQRTSWEELGGHAVRVIGWGVEDGTPYWLIANSWNTHWGDQGTFKILRGSDECGIESEMVAGVPVVNKY